MHLFPFQMSVDERVVQQYWCGASHLAENHHLPAQYQVEQEHLLDETQRYHRLTPNMTHVKGGRRMTDAWVQMLCDEMMAHSSEPRNYVICCGSNNIRDNGVIGIWKSRTTITNWYRTLIQTIEKTEHGTLLVVSPIPDNRLWTGWIGDEIDSDLREMCRAAGPRVRYAPFRSTKVPFNREKKILHYRWQRELFHDDVHLNREGARRLAEVIVRQQCNFPSGLYGFSKSGTTAARVAGAKKPSRPLPSDHRAHPYGRHPQRHLPRH